MGILEDFREVIKKLKHSKISEKKTNFCPKCGSKKIFISSGSDTYPRMYGITPRKFVCSECDYFGPIVMEQVNGDTS